MTSYAHWNSRDTNLWINQLLSDWIEGPLHWRKCIPEIVNLRYRDLKLRGLRDEPVNINWLHGHNTRLPSKFMTLYPKVSAALCPHQSICILSFYFGLVFVVGGWLV